MSRTLGTTQSDVDPWQRQFASDNYAGICPEAWEGLAAANVGHAVAYGDDPYTARAERALGEFFETDCRVFFTFNGTAANALAIATLCRSYQAVVCHEWSHLATDECGAPEFFSGGAKVLTVAGEAGKLTADSVRQRVLARTDVHYSQTRALSLTQATEVGTVYQAAEIAELAEMARGLGLGVHLDGARLANALAYLEVAAKALTWQAGVDVVSLGGTKNGLPVGDVLVFFNQGLADEFAHRRKQAGQLASKMRFLSAPWAHVLESGAFLAHARHANTMAQRLRQGLQKIAGLRLLFATQANSVFVDMDQQLRESLRARGWKFYGLLGDNVCRLMCAWDTTAADVDRLCADIRSVVQQQ